jgi:two-component system, cell cycle sensor histidine kinase and response regulator CckA
MFERPGAGESRKGFGMRVSKEFLGSRILIVEDEVLVAEEIKQRLLNLGLQVAGLTATADKAIQAAACGRPDLVLMDIRLTAERESIAAGVEIQQRLNIPVVYLTAFSYTNALLRGMEVSPYGYLLKPFQDGDLLVAVETAIHRHRLEQRLEESEVRYAATLSSIADGVIATDADGRVTFMNTAAAALTGWTLEEAQGVAVEDVFALFDEGSRAPLENPVRRALLQTAAVSISSAVLINRNDESIVIDDCASLIATEDGKRVGAVTAFRDIRERRLAQDALKRVQEHLSQTLKMESLGRLASGVAHDFNNLLTVINGYCTLFLKKDNLDTEIGDGLREILGAGERAVALVKQLLAFSRKQTLTPKVLDLNTLVRDSKKLLQRLIGPDIRLVMNLLPQAPQVQVDSSQLEQILMNLATNARDAMPEGGELSIETKAIQVYDAQTAAKPEMKPGSYVILAVTDTGCGMNESTAARIFEPFFTTKEPGKGTGLGMATVYGIVKQSDGYIYVYTEPGIGTTFEIYLPAVGVEAAAQGEAPKMEAPQRGSETILLVEDEAAVRAVCASVLRSNGYTVLESDSGTEALKICERHKAPIHLLVIDVLMPKMSGTKLAQRVWSSRPEIKVLFISGHTDDTVLVHSVLDGKAAFLQKPFTETSLAAKVRKTLDLPAAGHNASVQSRKVRKARTS